MRHFLKKWIPVLLAVGIIVSVGWYFLVYDTTLTRDFLLQQAQRQEENGNISAAVWLYNLAYLQSGNDETVAIELSEQLKAIGNYSKAETTLRKAIQDGGGVEVYIALCKTYIEQDKLIDAVAMLDKVTNKTMKAQLDVLRPQAPAASLPSGSYNQYLRLEIFADSNSLYVSTDLDYPSIHADGYADAIKLTGGATTVYALCIGENGLISPLSVFHYYVDSVVQEVVFADKHMEDALRKQLQIPENQPLYSDVLWQVEEFTVPAQAQSLADLQWLTGLKKLTIESIACQDFTPLSALTDLNTLVIRNSVIAGSDLGFLSGMEHLTHLTLSACGVSTIADLANMPALEYLDLSNNTVRDLSALSNITTLVYLDLSYNALITLRDIQSLTELQVLDVSFNNLNDTSHLSAFTKLTDLNISSNDLYDKDLAAIGTLSGLQHLAAAYNHLTFLDVLASCTQLQTLDVSHNTLLNIQVLAKLTMLEELDFSHNEVKVLPNFQVNCALRVIRGEYNLLTSVEKLAGLTNLTHVYMDYNASLSNINNLRNCPQLQQVNVYGTKVRDVSALTAVGILVHYTPKT